MLQDEAHKEKYITWPALLLQMVIHLPSVIKKQNLKYICLHMDADGRLA